MPSGNAALMKREATPIAAKRTIKRRRRKSVCSNGVVNSLWNCLYFFISFLRCIAVSIVVVSCHRIAVGIVNADDIALRVLAEEILRSRSGVGMVGEADDCAGCVILIDEVTLRLKCGCGTLLETVYY